jgi:C1A family cysteine protease
LAASGKVFNTRTGFGFGFDPVPPAGDQRPCSSSAAWAATYAAEAAVAVATRQTPVKLSVQDLAFCGPDSPKTCSAGLSVAQAVRSLASRPPVKEACLPYAPSTDPTKLCSYTCRAQHPLVATGTFRAVQLTGVAQMQAHIRRHGSVITRCDIHSNFAAYMAANKGGIYTGPEKLGEAPVEGHSVLLIGYNNAEGYWLALNSWGRDFGEQGVFKVGGQE